MSSRMVPSTTWGLVLLALAGCATTGDARSTAVKGPVALIDSGPAAAAGSRRVAVLLGVGQFDDRRWPALRFPAADSAALAQQLQERGGFTVQLLNAPEQTGRAALLEALDALAASSLRPDDTVVVYLSTHGTLSRDLGGQLRQVLVLRDTGHERPLDSGLELSELLQRFDRLPSQRKVLILATCYSGAGKSSLSEAMRSYLRSLKGATPPPLYDVSRATMVLSASAWGEAAREDEQLGQDIYTHFLIEALRGYDPNGDGATSVSEAHDFARQQTYRYTQGQQRPTAIMTIEGDDPIVLGGQRTAAGSPLLLSYRSSFDGLRVAVDGVPKGELPGGVVVEPGWHEIALERPAGNGAAATVLRRRVLVQPGEQVDLGALYEQELPLQLELRLGGGLVPGTPHGSPVVPLGAGGLLVRRQDTLIRGLDLSWLTDLGYGVDSLAINQQRFVGDVAAGDTRLGLGTHFAFGPCVVNVDGWGGGGLHWLAVRSALYGGPRLGLYAVLGVSAALRLRFAEVWSIGGGVGGDYRFGAPSGPGGTAWLGAALSL
ncbi:MAG: caspase family protein [Deltaproteobacteria bacterium]|nr:caspase family protein [Deltaproteobacteria bacterium]